jgi:F0F1-type ATP synthase gamma subunit
MREVDYPYNELNDNSIQYYNSEDRCYRCPVCGKVFYVMVADSYAYKFLNKFGKTRTLCSWKCLNKAKNTIKENFKDGRIKIYSYPEDFPTNWEFVYNRFLNKAITKPEAVRLLNLSSNHVFEKLRETYDEWKWSSKL